MTTNLPVMKRSAAKEAGMIRYNNGKPCPAGHLSERFVSTGTCCICLRIKTKEWQAVEVNKEYNRACAKQYRIDNKEKRAATARAWALRNADKLRLKRAEYDKGRRIERCLAETRRRARKHESRGTHTAAQVKDLVIRQNHRCSYCGKSIRKGYHIDHIEPLCLGGSNAINNIQLLCAPCNLRKSKKPPLVFAREIGLLL